MDLGTHREQAAAPEPAGPIMRYLVERLAEHPAAVFSRRGEVLLQSHTASALLGGHTWLGGSSCCHHLDEVGAIGSHRLRRYRHAELGALEFHRQLLVDAQEQQILLILTTAPGSLSEQKLRLLSAATG